MAEPAKPFVANATPIIAVFSAIISAIVLAIPSILLYKKLKEWYKKRRESKQKAKLSNKETELDVEYEIIEAAERCIQTDPCTNLSDLYLTASREIFGDSIESFSEKPIIVARSVSETGMPDTPIASEKSSFFYKRSLKNLSTVSQLETISDAEVSTQTVESYQQLQMSAWLPLEFEGEDGNGTQANRATRYQPPVSSNNIICPRRPSRDKFGRKDPCGCQENKQKGGGNAHRACTIV